MSNLFDKENQRIIKTMNTYMGTEHRETPYEMNNPNDLKQLLTLAVAAYRDYRNYWLVLARLQEDFDESLENYDTISWFNLYGNIEKVDGIALECVSALNTALNKFDEITDKAKENFIKILNLVMSAPPETQKVVLGHSYNIKPQDIDGKIDKLLETLDEREYQYKIPDNFDTLLRIMAEELPD